MTIYKSGLLAILISGLCASVLPALADDDIFPAPAEAGPAGMEAPPPPELTGTFGLPILGAQEGDVVMLLDDGASAMAFGGSGGSACSAQRISLSDDQLEKIHSLRNDYLDAVGPKMCEIASKHRKLKDVLLATSIDSAKAKSLQGDINSLKDEISNLKLQNKLDCLSVLTPEQRKEIRSRMLRFSGHHHHHGGPFGPGGHEKHWGMQMREHGGPAPGQG
jgi:Spy/CpxP family protein refolding chaperone